MDIEDLKEDWKKAEEELLDGKEGLEAWKRILLLISGVLVVLLMLSYVLVSWPLGDIIAGKLVSSVIDDEFSIIVDDVTVEFSEESLKELQQQFLDNEGQEFSVCLLGNVNGNEFMISEIFQPVIHEQSFSHVSSEPYPASALIHLHSHPHKRCIPSEQDLLTFQSFKSVRENALMIVMCEKERFTVVN